MLIKFNGVTPEIDESSFIAENSTIIGNVRIAADCSVFFGAVIRADETSVDIGAGSNVQDNCVIHGDEGYPIILGKNVTLGHGAIVHGAVVDDNVIIGMGATVMNGVHIGRNSIIGAGALCPENMQIPAGSVVVGVPAKVIKNAEEYNESMTKLNASNYVELGRKYKAESSALK